MTRTTSLLGPATMTRAHVSVPAPVDGYLRLAAVQIDYTPAIPQALDDPAFESPGRHSLCPKRDPKKPWGKPVLERFRALQSRIRAVYTQHCAERLKCVVQACLDAHVHAVVFPEYAIPVECLIDLSAFAGDLVVVGGTHLVEATESAGRVYRHFGVTPPRPGTAVCPVMHGGRILELLPKLTPAGEELAFELQLGDTWKPVEIAGMVGKFGVLICKDFVDENSESRRGLVNPYLDNCRWIAVPSLTSARSVGEEFASHAKEHSKRGKRAVAHANRSREGGSRIYADCANWDEAPPGLGADEEAILVADIDMTTYAAGRSTSYDVRSAVKTVAVIPFLYESHDPASAAWFREWSALLGDRAAEQAPNGLSACSAWLSGHPIPDGCSSPLLRKSVDALLQEEGHWRSVDELARKTPCLVIGSGTLSPHLLAVSLAEGAADQVESWRNALASQELELAAVETAIHLRAKANALGSGGRAKNAVRRVASRVRGPVDLLTAVPTLLIENTLRDIDSDLEAYRAEYERGDFESALKRTLTRVEDLERILSTGHDYEATIAKFRRACLGAAASASNMGEVDQARALLSKLDPGELDDRSRALFAEITASVGDYDVALGALPASTDALDSENRERVEAVLQTIAILRGESPPLLLQDVTVQLHWAEACAKRRELAVCGSVCLSVLTRPELPTAARQWAVDLLRFALAASLSDDLPDHVVPVPLESREQVVVALEAGFSALRTADIAGNRRKALDAAERGYRILVEDPDWKAPLAETVVDQLALAAARAMKLAGGGDLEAATAAAPVFDHAWRGSLFLAELRARSGDCTGALNEVAKLRELFPNRPQIERVACQICRDLGRKEEAAEHAATAFKALPGIGQRLLLVQACWEAGQRGEAIALLEHVAVKARPSVLRAMGVIFAETSPQRAEGSLRQYLEMVPEDLGAELLLARILQQQHKHREAALVGWSAWQRGADRLSPEQLAGVAMSQLVSGQGEVERERVKTVLLELERRAVSDKHAEVVRAGLVLRLDRVPDGVGPVDFGVLEELGVVQRLPIADVKEAVSARAALARAADVGYRTGRIGLSGSLRLRNLTLPEYIVRAAHSAVEMPGLICAPFKPADDKIDDITNHDLLVTALELTLLVHLGLVADLRNAIGTGRILIFDVERQRIVEESLELSLPFDAQEEARANCVSRLLTVLRNADGAEGTVGVGSHQAPGLRTVSFGAWVEWLVRKGVLSKSETQTWSEVSTPCGPGESEVLNGAAGFVLGLDAALALASAADPVRIVGQLQSRWKVTVNDAVRPWLDGQILSARLKSDARQLADSVHGLVASGLEQGWIALVARPDTSDLPAIARGAPPQIGEVVLRPLHDAVALARAARVQGTVRLNAEFFSTLAPASLEFARALAWSSPHQYMKIAAELRSVAERDLHLPSLVKLVVPDRQKRRNLLEALAVLGFADAIGSRELIELAAESDRGLGAPRVARILDRMEWVAINPQHLGSPAAVVRHAGVYANAVFRTCCEEANSAWTEAKLTGFVNGLLDRLEAVSKHSGRDSVEVALGFLALMAVQSPKLSWREADDSRYQLDPDGVAATMWKMLWAWAAGSVARRAAYTRAMRLAWLCVDERAEHDGLLAVSSGAIWHAVAQSLVEAPADFFDNAAIEAVAILSACWTARPLSGTGFAAHGASGEKGTVTAEDVLVRAAEVVGHRRDVSGDVTRIHFPYIIDGTTGPGGFQVSVPFEAALLRIEDLNTAKAVAAAWKCHQGPHDGRAYILLQQFEQSPSNSDVRHALARHAASSMWRFVLKDPAYLTQFALAGHLGTRLGADSEDLCELLSEPPGGLPTQSNIAEALRDRVERGVWRDREDRGALFMLASAIPGTASIGSVAARLASEHRDEEVAAALERIERHEDQPVGRLFADVVLVSVAASRHGVVVSGSGSIDLRQRVPRLLGDVVGSPRNLDGEVRGGAGRLAEYEGAVLRCCLAVVVQAYPGLTERGTLWLCWRLFGWFAEQLELVSEEARRDALARLAALAPKPQSQGRDPLDPMGYSSLEYRAAAVVHAIEIAEDAFSAAVDSGVHGGQRLDYAPCIGHLVSMAEEYAEPGPSGDLLDWSGPASLPDIAASTLLSVDMALLARVSSETRRRLVARIPTGNWSSWWKLFASRIVVACMVVAEKMDESEAVEFEAKLRALEDSPDSRHWRFLGFSALYAAGRASLREEVEALLLEHSGASDASHMFSLILRACPTSEMEAQVKRVLAAALDRGLTVVELLHGLRRVQEEGSEEQKVAATVIWEEVSKDPRFTPVSAAVSSEGAIGAPSAPASETGGQDAPR